MKHIAIIPNYSAITELIKSEEISPNFLVKSENDQKVHFSNAAGYQVLAGGNIYNMYLNTDGELKADISSSGGVSFQILKEGQPITADLDITAIAYDCQGSQEENQESETGVTNFAYSWSWGDATWEIRYFYESNLVQVLGNYFLTDQECCERAGGMWDPENQTCIMPSCEGLEDSIADCEERGGTWDYDTCTCNEPPAEEEPVEEPEE